MISFNKEFLSTYKPSKHIFILLFGMFSLLSSTLFAQTDSPFCETSVFHFGGNAESEIILTVENAGGDDITVTAVGLNAADPLDLLIVNSGGVGYPGSMVGPNEWSVTFPGANPTTSFFLLWSFVDFGGNWQSDSIDFTTEATCPAASGPESPFCETSVFHFDGNSISEVILTVENAGGDDITVTAVGPDPADPLDFLLVISGGVGYPGTMVGPNEYEVTFPGTDPTTTFFAQWSFQNFGGNWQSADIDFTTAATCPTVMPPDLDSPFCETSVFHFDGNSISEVILTVENAGGDDITVTAVGPDPADPLDFLLVISGGVGYPGTMVGPNEYEVTFPGTDPTTTFFAQWSFQNFGGNWQSADIDFTTAATCPTVTPPDLDSPFCETSVFHFDGNSISEVILTVENAGGDDITITAVGPDPADPLDFFLVISGGVGYPGTMTGPNEYEVTFPGTDPTTTFFAQWSFLNFGGNWQSADIDFTTAATCPTVMPPDLDSPYCDTPVFHFDGNSISEVILTVENAGGDDITITAVGPDPADPLDFFLVISGGVGYPGTMTGPNEWEVTFTGTDPTTTFFAQWSFVNFGGNWQSADIDFTTAATCPFVMPPDLNSQYCGTPVFHFDGNTSSEVLLTVENAGGDDITITAVGPDPTDPLDFFLVISGGVGYSGTMIAPNEWEVTFTGTNPNTTFFAQWSFLNFGGNWQSADIDVITAATCPVGDCNSSNGEISIKAVPGN